MKKIIVFSYHVLNSGEGSLVRIYSMLDALIRLYGEEAVDWINVSTVNFLNTNEKNQLKKRYSYSKCKTKLYFHYFFRNAFLRSVSFTLFKAFLYIQIYLKYRKYENILFWVEMPASYSFIKSFVRFFGIDLIFDVHGTVDEKINMVSLEDRNIELYLNALKNEISCFHDAKGIVAVSNPMIQFYRSKYASITKNTIVIPTTPDPKVFHYSQDTRREYRKKIFNDDAFLLVYSGGVQKYQCIDEILLFFDKISKCHNIKKLNPCLLLLIWDAAFILEEKCRSLNISSENIFHFQLAQSEVSNFLQAADLGVVFRNNITTNFVASPTKIGEYLFSGLPILGSPCLGDIKNLFRDYSIGFSYDLEKDIDLESFAQFCDNIVNNREDYSLRCIEAAKYYYSNNNFERIKLLIDNAVASAS